MGTRDPNAPEPGSTAVATDRGAAVVARQRAKLPETSEIDYWVDFERVKVRNGETRYHPVAVPLKPGINGNDGRGGSAVPDGVQIETLQRIRVPRDFPVIAFGKKVAGPIVRMHLGTDRNGKHLYRYDDAWTQWKQVGRSWRRIYDADGFWDFCKRVEGLRVNGTKLGPPDEDVVESEHKRLMTTALQHERMAHQSVGAAAVAKQIRENLNPPQETPPAA